MIPIFLNKAVEDSVDPFPQPTGTRFERHTNLKVYEIGLPRGGTNDIPSLIQIRIKDSAVMHLVNDSEKLIKEISWKNRVRLTFMKSFSFNILMKVPSAPIPRPQVRNAGNIFNHLIDGIFPLGNPRGQWAKHPTTHESKVRQL